MVRWYYLTDLFEGFDWVGFLKFGGIILLGIAIISIIRLLIGIYIIHKNSFKIIMHTNAFDEGTILSHGNGNILVIGKKKIGDGEWEYRVTPFKSEDT